MSTGRRAKTSSHPHRSALVLSHSRKRTAQALCGDPRYSELRGFPRRGPTVLHDLSDAAAMMYAPLRHYYCASALLFRSVLTGKPLGTEDGTISSIFDL